METSQNCQEGLKALQAGAALFGWEAASCDRALLMDQSPFARVTLQVLSDARGTWFTQKVVRIAHKGSPWKGVLRTLVRRGGMCLSFTWWCGAQWGWTHLRKQRTKAALLCSRKARMKKSIILAILTMFLADANAWDGREKERPWCSWCCAHTGHPWHRGALVGTAIGMGVQIVMSAQPQTSRCSLGSGDSPLLATVRTGLGRVVGHWV